jgi:hypothetical protein
MSEPDDDAHRSRTNMIVLAAVVALVVLGIVLFKAMKYYSDMQDCAAAGHRDCAPVDTGQ